MNILVSGGSKTSNIVNGVKKKLESGGADFIIKEDIEDIQDIFYTGGEFDRALISVEAWTDDLRITDEYQYTRKLSKFVEAMERYSNGDETFVFLVSDEKYAEVVSEQILPIASRSAVVLKEKPYSVSFMKSLMLCTLEAFPKELLYNPTLETAQLEEENGIEIEEIATESSIVELEETDSLDEITIESLEEQLTNEDSLFEHNDFNTFDDINSTEDTFDNTDAEVIESEETAIEHLDVEEIQVDDEETTEQLEENTSQIDEHLNKEAEIEWVEPIDTNPAYFSQAYNEEKGEQNLEEKVQEHVKNSFDDTLYSEDTHEESEDEQVEKEPVAVKKQRKKIGLFSKRNKKEKEAKKVEEKLEQRQEETEPIKMSQGSSISNETTQLLDVFARRGNSIAVTGCGGTGNSLIAYNLANTLCNLGYNVLLVDFDTRNRTQSYISRDAIECTDNENSSLMQSLRTSQGINAYINILRQGFHTLTMGPAGDIVSLEKMLEDKTLSRFINLAKVNHHFVVYDIPFDNAVGIADEVIYTCDNLVVTVEANNHGIMKALLGICNIDKEELADTIFKKGQLLYNKYDGMKNLFGKKVKRPEDIARVMDEKVMEFIGVDPGNYFTDMEVCGFMQYDREVENCWFNKTQYSDTSTGRDIFIELIKNILLK